MTDIVIDEGYRPTEDEPFMNERQREYFRRKLIRWKHDILKEAQETLATLQSENENHPDLADRASSETDRAIELRARDRQRKLIAKIDAALARIEDGSYGYCEETGDPISLKRLEDSKQKRAPLAEPFFVLNPRGSLRGERSRQPFLPGSSGRPSRRANSASISSTENGSVGFCWAADASLA